MRVSFPVVVEKSAFALAVLDHFRNRVVGHRGPKALDEMGDRLGMLLVQLGVLSRNRRNFRHPSSSPATSASRSIILPSLWKV
jgi:hypothetical protein